MAGFMSCVFPPSSDSLPQEEADGAIVPQVLSRDSIGAPALAVDGDRLYLCYYSQTAGKFLLRRSADRGETWGAALEVLGDTISNLASAECAMAKNGSSLFILASDGTRIFLAQVDESGGTLSLAGCTEQDFGKCSPAIASMGAGFACACYDPSLIVETDPESCLLYGNSDNWARDGITGAYTNSNALSYPEKWSTGAVAFGGLSLYVDSSGKTWLAEARNSESQLRLVSYPSGSLTAASAAEAIDIGDTAPLNVGNALYPSIGYADDSSCFLSYVGRTTDSSAKALAFYFHFDTTGPSPTTANRAVVVDPSTGCSYPRTAYASGTAYIAYRDTSTRSLRFARGVLAADGSGCSFSRTTLDALGAAASDGICALTASGTAVYIAYLDSAVGGLKFLRSTDGGLGW